MRQKIYIASPMTSSGELWANVQAAVIVMRDLIELGFAPLCPALTAYADPHGEVEHSVWMEVDLPWVESAAAVLRLPGESRGADIEVAHAIGHDIPVYYSIEALADSLGVSP